MDVPLAAAPVLGWKNVFILPIYSYAPRLHSPIHLPPSPFQSHTPLPFPTHFPPTPAFLALSPTSNTYPINVYFNPHSQPHPDTPLKALLFIISLSFNHVYTN